MEIMELRWQGYYSTECGQEGLSSKGLKPALGGRPLPTPPLPLGEPDGSQQMAKAPLEGFSGAGILHQHHCQIFWKYKPVQLHNKKNR